MFTNKQAKMHVKTMAKTTRIQLRQLCRNTNSEDTEIIILIFLIKLGSNYNQKIVLKCHFITVAVFNKSITAGKKLLFNHVNCNKT